MEVEPIEIWGSLQEHRSVQPIRGGYGVCPTIGTTDLGLPRVVEITYEQAESLPPLSK